MRKRGIKVRFAADPTAGAFSIQEVRAGLEKMLPGEALSHAVERVKRAVTGAVVAPASQFMHQIHGLCKVCKASYWPNDKREVVRSDGKTIRLYPHRTDAGVSRVCREVLA
jgi:hypothetical protein